MEQPKSSEREVLLEGFVYKSTLDSGVVVLRRVHVLAGGKFYTFHDWEKDPRNRKSWYLDGRCELSPKSAAEVETAVPCVIRGPGTWTITASVKGGKAGKHVSLYMFTLKWPKAWSAKGYTTFTFGFEGLEAARTWYTHFRQQILALKLKFNSDRSLDPSASFNHAISNPAFMVDATPPPLLRGSSCGGGILATASSDSLLFGSPKASMLMAASRSTAAGPSAKVSHLSDFLPPNLPDTPRLVPAPEPTLDPASTPELFMRSTPDLTMKSAPKTSDASSSMNMNMHRKSPEYRMPNFEANSQTPSPMGSDTRLPTVKKPRRWGTAIAERWVPYKQTNGVAIYHLDKQTHDSSDVGEEYMVSAVVRAPPREVLDALMTNTSNFTILGPACKVEVMHGSKESTGFKLHREILHIVLEAEGWAGWLCAPREMVVERMQKEDEGCFVVLFSSMPAENVRRFKNSEPLFAEDGSRVVVEVHEVSESKGRKQKSLYQEPVLGTVHGGYTISPLEEYTLDTSPESLITCIIKVDLGGVCGDRCWAKPAADLFGWTDAFLDRILMSVTLIRDEVESNRFLMRPFSMMADEGKGVGEAEIERAESDDGTTFEDASEWGDAEDSCPTPALSRMSLRPPGGPIAQTLSSPRPLPNLKEVQSDSTYSAKPIGLDLERMRGLAFLERHFWEELHVPGQAAPFRVRGPTYLKDRKKIPAGQTVFTFGAMDVIELPTQEPIEHVARFLPSVRQSGMPFGIIINLVIPGVPLLGIVATYVTQSHPDILGPRPKDPMGEDHDWTPFDFVLHRFIHGDAATRNLMIKLIPHIAAGSWMIRQSVGTTPVILGKALKTTYTVTPQYIEVDIDISANQVAAYVTGLVRGATKSLVIDMGFVLEGTAPWELPEALLGTLRLNYLDLKFAKKLDTTREIPLRPPMPP